MTTFKRLSHHEWTWQTGIKHHAVRYFPNTKRLVWSSWMTMGDAPSFEDGHAQTADDFLETGQTYGEPPQALLDELRATLGVSTEEEAPKRKGFFGWMRK